MYQNHKTERKDTLENRANTPFKYVNVRLEDLNIDYPSGARVTEVPSSQLPEGVLGIYDPSSHTIRVASNISEYEKQFVKKHESAHALGLRDEAKTDAYAASQAGYNPFYFRKAA